MVFPGSFIAQKIEIEEVGAAPPEDADAKDILPMDIVVDRGRGIIKILGGIGPADRVVGGIVRIEPGRAEILAQGYLSLGIFDSENLHLQSVDGVVLFKFPSGVTESDVVQRVAGIRAGFGHSKRHAPGSDPAIESNARDDGIENFTLPVPDRNFVLAH